MEGKSGVRLSSELLLRFSELFLKPQYDEPVDHPKAHLEWWDLVCSDEKLVAIAAPRGHAKSTAITLVYVLASICFRLKRHIIIVSDTEGQAVQFLGNLKKELTDNTDLRDAFSVKRLVKDSETEVILEFMDGRRVRLYARGSGQAIRGTNWMNYRPDLIVCDDLENDEIVLNEERRTKFRHWFYNVLIPAGSKRVEVRVVGTILHEDSLLNRLMPNPIEDKGAVVEPLKTWTQTIRPWLSVLYRAHPDFDDWSVRLWPEQFDEARLRKLQQMYVDDGNPDGYTQEYLNQPISGDSAYFQPQDFLPIMLEQIMQPEPENYYVGVDLAISEKSRRAFTVFCIAGMAEDGVLRIREVIRRRMDSDSIIETFFQVHQKYKRQSHLGSEPVFLVEDENISKALGPVLEREMRERHEFLFIEKMPPIHDKELRARSIQARMRSGMVEFAEEEEWFPAMKHEMCTFPRSTYQDQVDAIAWVGYYVAQMAEGPSWEDIDEDEYEAEMEEAEWGDDEDGFGPNAITGY